MSIGKRSIYLAVNFLLLSAGVSTSFAANEVAQTFNYQGQFYNELGTAPLLDNVSLTLEIFDPTGSCLLYSEQQNNINLNSSNGLFSIQVGSLTSGSSAAKRTVTANAPHGILVDPGMTMEKIFSNLGPVTGAIANCAAGYTPSAGDGRILRVIVDDLTTSTIVTLSPDLPLSAAPQAMTAQTLQGFVPSNFIQVDSHMTQANADTLTSAADASSLHNHDSLYVKLNTASNQNLGTGVTYTTGDLGVGTSTPGSRIESDTVTATTIGEIVKGAASQSADLMDFETSAGAVLSHVDSSGNFYVGANQLATQSYVSSAISSASTDWAHPGTIGSGTPNTGAFTTLAFPAASMNFVTGPSNTLELQGTVVNSYATLALVPSGTAIQSELDIAGNSSYGGSSSFGYIRQSGLNTLIGNYSPTGNLYLTANNATAVTILPGGQVGVGNTPVATLDVAGQVHAQVYSNGAGTAIDWNKGNVQTTSAVCSGTGNQFSFANMLEGGSYTLIVTGTATGSCNFNATSGSPTSVTPAGTTGWSFQPTNATPSAGTTIYTMLRAGNVIYVSWISGFAAGV